MNDKPVFSHSVSLEKEALGLLNPIMIHNRGEIVETEGFGEDRKAQTPSPRFHCRE